MDNEELFGVLSVKPKNSKVKEVFKLLGVKPYEIFTLKGVVYDEKETYLYHGEEKIATQYYIDTHLCLRYIDIHNCGVASKHQTTDILIGFFNIERQLNIRQFFPYRNKIYIVKPRRRCEKVLKECKHNAE